MRGLVPRIHVATHEQMLRIARPRGSPGQAHGDDDKRKRMNTGHLDGANPLLVGEREQDRIACKGRSATPSRNPFTTAAKTGVETRGGRTFAGSRSRRAPAARMFDSPMRSGGRVGKNGPAGTVPSQAGLLREPRTWGCSSTPGGTPPRGHRSDEATG